MNKRKGRPRKEESYSSWYSWLPSALGMGLLVLVAHEFLGQWLPKQILGACEFTVLVFWITVTGFKKERRNSHFWKIVGLFFGGHLIATWLLSRDGFDLSFFDKNRMRLITIMAVAESIVISATTAFFIRGKDLLDEFEN
jgi:hypothetical protein